MKKSELLKQGNYLTVIKPLAHKIGLEETIILMELVGMEEYKEQKHIVYKEMMQEQNKKINPHKVSFHEQDNAFECTATELELATTIKRKKQIDVLKKMSDLNLLKTEKRNIPAKRFIVLNHDMIERVVEESLTEYQRFKDQFFAEKKEAIQKQMEKRKENRATKSLLSQKGTTDNIKVFEDNEENNIRKPQSNQLSQKGTTSSPDSGQLVVPNEDTLNNIESKNISLKNNKNLNLNPNEIDLYKILWDTKIPHNLKNKIKIMIVNREVSLNAEQILEIEDAYNYQIQKGYVIPDCDFDDIAALNDDQFSQTVTKMLKTVANIRTMRGLIKEWVEIAFTYKQDQFRILDVSMDITPFSDWLNT